MKTVSSLLLGLFLSTSASALEVYNCDIQSQPKGSHSVAMKKTFLSSAFYNQIEFHEGLGGKTVLEINVDSNGRLNGSVNGQYNFILTGDASNGSFQSAYHSGSIQCSPALQADYLLQFIPWKNYFSVDSELSVGHIRTSVQVSDLQYGNICFVGDAAAANKAIEQSAGVIGMVISPYQLDFTFAITECAKGHGSNPDDWSCEKTKKSVITRSVKNCVSQDILP